MSDEELRDELVTVLGAGHETTATGARLGDRAAAAHAAGAGRLRDSIAAGEDDYLDATIKETLRARPVIVDVARKLTAPATIGGYELPAGHLRAAGDRRPPLPRGPLPRARSEFRPERFLDGKADNYAWIPFGGGVRRCIGAAFAEYEMRIDPARVPRAGRPAAPPTRSRSGSRSATSPWRPARAPAVSAWSRAAALDGPRRRPLAASSHSS